MFFGLVFPHLLDRGKIWHFELLQITQHAIKHGIGENLPNALPPDKEQIRLIELCFTSLSAWHSPFIFIFSNNPYTFSRARNSRGQSLETATKAALALQ